MTDRRKAIDEQVIQFRKRMGEVSPGIKDQQIAIQIASELMAIRLTLQDIAEHLVVKPGSFSEDKEP